jgi:dienelactone hydrolase
MKTPPYSLSAIAILLVIGISCSEPDFLKGINKQVLFATPTHHELEAVMTDWSSRDLSPKAYAVEQSAEIRSDLMLKIVSFRVGVDNQYGALLIPDSDTDLPVRMYIGGFKHGNTTNGIGLESDDSGSGEPFIFAFPALRGQSISITINGTEYTSPVSEGVHCDAFDGATDDAIAFLNIIEATEAKADMDRVSVRGGSRGATVALLLAERDKRVKLAIAVAGPANLLTLTSQNENDLTYQCQFLENLVHGTETLAQVRHKMIASSPLFFAAELPKTQLHLAANDDIVPVSQGYELQTEINRLGTQDKFELFMYEGRDHANIATDNQELQERIREFLSQL